VVAAAVLSMLSVAAIAEDPQVPIDTVTVEARREQLKRQISTFVSEIALQSRTESLARWQLPICPLVAGLTFEQGKMMFERISQVATAAGVPLGPPDCNPNLLVVRTPEPEKMLRQWWRNMPKLLNSDRGTAAIEHTIRTPAPVRVFYNACSVPPALAKTFGRRVLASCNTGMPGSRLTWDAVRVLYSVIVIVDKQKTEGVNLGALTDYIAMVSLAHLRRNPELGTAPTILRLFDDTATARPEQMSAWDQAFLASLYKTDAGSVAQLSEIKRQMTQGLTQ
jgi:hypothetical protein